MDKRSRPCREAKGISQRWLGVRSQQGTVEHRVPGVSDTVGAGFGGNLPSAVEGCYS